MEDVVAAPPPIAPADAARFQPINRLVAEKYAGRTDLLVADLYQLTNYLMREPGQHPESAESLRRRFNLVADLAAAFDEVK